MSETEELLNALINNTDIGNFIPSSRVEQILLCCIKKQSARNCGPSQSRVENLLQELATVIEQGGGGGEVRNNVPINITTSEAMDELPVIENVGKVYKYTGITTTKYTNGDIYIVKEA